MVVNQTCALNMHIHNTYICYVYKNDGVNNELPWGYDRLKTLNDASAVSSHENCPSILISTEPCQSGIADRMGWRQQSASDSHSHRGAVVDKRLGAEPKTVRGFRWYNSTPNSTLSLTLSLTPSSRYLRPCFGLGGIGGVCVSACAKWRIKQKAKKERIRHAMNHTRACSHASSPLQYVWRQKLSFVFRYQRVTADRKPIIQHRSHVHIGCDHAIGVGIR